MKLAMLGLGASLKMLQAPARMAWIMALGSERCKASGGLKKALERLTDLGFITLTNPEKPTSKTQKRKLTDKGIRLARTLP